MTPVERALRERIATEGPIGVDMFMEACNSFYYATRDPLGAAGDFVTAPEVSQLFGELVGAALADCWLRGGSPDDAVYAELGPGRGTLAADALRVLKSAGFAGSVHFVETSPLLREAQGMAVPGAHWHDTIEALPPCPLLVVANEFFDALPVRQFAGGVERRVTVAAGALAFDRDGAIVEESPARTEAMQRLGRHLAIYGGVALIIDYGHARSAPGDTLQAVRGHAFAPVLANPGEQDLTTHVDFEALLAAAQGCGVATTCVVTQGDWLRALGIELRADSLVRSNPAQAEAITAAVERLTAADEMGELFKAAAIHSPGWPAPAGFPA